jgi:hypothetical protein
MSILNYILYLIRKPAVYDIIKSIFRYWNRLEYLEKFPLLQNAYEQSKQLYQRGESKCDS